MSQKRKYGVLIGRFQPLHNGHLQLLQNIDDEFENIIVLVGSANQRRSILNPFSYEERRAWFELIAKQTLQANIIIHPLNDYLYSETKWESEVFSIVSEIIEDTPDEEVFICGHEKDDTSYYLRSFPQWRLRLYDNHEDLHATQIREGFFNDMVSGNEFSGNPAPGWGNWVPRVVRNDLHSFQQKKGFNGTLLGEYVFYLEEKNKFAGYPYPETLKFMCADAVVICKGHVLLIQRRFAPGAGCWALPGGFVNQKETFAETALRELIEESGIKVPTRTLRMLVNQASKSLKTSRLFDDPRRSIGIPRVSMAFCIEVEPGHDGRFPKLRAGSDAADAKWVPLAATNKIPLYDDHWDMIDYFTGSL